jgi:hypothetical protein
MRKGDVSHTVSPLFRANYEEQPATKLFKLSRRQAREKANGIDAQNFWKNLNNSTWNGKKVDIVDRSCQEENCVEPLYLLRFVGFCLTD